MSIIGNIYLSIKQKETDKRIAMELWLRDLREHRKYRDPRRKAIADSFPLTKEQREQIDNFYETNYGERIGHIWHQNYAAHAGRFDYRFFPEPLYYPKFEAYQNQNTEAVRMIADKNFLPLIAKGIRISMPKTIVDCTNGVIRDGEARIITPKMATEILKNCDSFFIKPSVDSYSGQGCGKFDGDCKIEFTNNALKVNEKKYSHDFVVQELMRCDATISEIYPLSVNTFRIITYLWNNEVRHMPVILRVGRGGNHVDNAHAGGMFVAVDDEGTICNHAITEFNEQFENHPETGIQFNGHKIKNFSKMIDTVKRFHEAIPQIGCINWDTTIDDNGTPIVIEANTQEGSVWLPQMAHGTAAFGDITAEVLQWVRFMNRLKPHERKRYVAGMME